MVFQAVFSKFSRLFFLFFFQKFRKNSENSSFFLSEKHKRIMFLSVNN